MNNFTERVLSVVASIPRGETLSYSEVAEKAGSPKAYRVVGSIMKKNKDLNIPCHRVIKSNGEVGEYNQLRGTPKEELLRKESGVDDKKK